MLKPKIPCCSVLATRHAAGITQKQAAELMDVTERTWQLWETVSGMRQRDYDQFISLAINPTSMRK
jgi:DNA-binding XRE family transcriptional regulator